MKNLNLEELKISLTQSLKTIKIIPEDFGGINFDDDSSDDDDVMMFILATFSFSMTDAVAEAVKRITGYEMVRSLPDKIIIHLDPPSYDQNTTITIPMSNGVFEHIRCLYELRNGAKYAIIDNVKVERSKEEKNKYIRGLSAGTKKKTNTGLSTAA